MHRSVSSNHFALFVERPQSPALQALPLQVRPLLLRALAGLRPQSPALQALLAPVSPVWVVRLPLAVAGLPQELALLVLEVLAVQPRLVEAEHWVRRQLWAAEQ